MDPALLAIATTSANALVSLMTTDIWEQAKSGVTKCFQRSSKSSENLANELEEARSELTDSIERGDFEETSHELQQTWKGKFRRFLIEHPEGAGDLDELITLWRENAENGAAGTGAVINQNASAKDNSRIYQQGTGIQLNN
ncbi:hypothetical protein [Streptomyces sp. NBC_01361]|uniref:hypothetical protein n=1 Tax=Streptomyces sp. NBC_01361 TaxID=2903838 RepID=UPI002E37EEA9|nr:hypothetical protein [Streptomyces sp. NBC_01361]